MNLPPLPKGLEMQSEDVRAAIRAYAADAVARASAAAPTQTEPLHGVNCQKAAHVGGGHLHAADDDTPYDVDGVRYCGRCHRCL